MSLYAFDTMWPADSVEFCPHPDALDILVCGTYNLEKSVSNKTEADEGTSQSEISHAAQLRRGKCLLFAVDQSSQQKTTEGTGYTLNKLQEVALPAVPDLKWSHSRQTGKTLLAAADTEGHVTLHTLSTEARLLTQVQSIDCATDDVLCLSIDWSDRIQQSSNIGNLVVSMSNGSIALLKSSNSMGLTLTDTWHAHDFEPWIAAWNYWDTNILYTGGDDLKMKGWDIRQSFSQPTFVNKRFDAGVTTVQSHPHVEHLLAVGSYDDKVRLFDARKPLVPLTEVNVGGGAWRVKWHPSPERKDDLLVACMHDGCKVLRFGETAGEGPATLESTVIQRFDEHSSMAYGADWSYADIKAEKGTQDSLIASCSFYDHVLHLWRG